MVHVNYPSPEIPSLEPVDLEALVVLCERGEFLMHEDCRFWPAEALLNVGFAKRLMKHGKLTVVAPTELGLQMCEIHKRLKSALRLGKKEE